MKNKLLILYLFCASQSIAQTQTPKPHVLFIIADDLRNQLGCYGYLNIKSPYLDSFAKEAVLFRNAFAQQAICSPSRTSFLTGRRPNQTLIYNNRDHFRGTTQSLVTLPQYFKNKGYFTRAFGKVFHNPFLDDLPSWSTSSVYFDGPDYGPENQVILDSMVNVLKAKGKFQIRHLEHHPQTGQPLREVRQGESVSWISWEEPEVEDDYFVDGKLADLAVEAIKNYDVTENLPFFFAVGLHKPHLPYVAPKKYFDPYVLEDIQLSTFKAPENASEYAFHNFDELREYIDIPDEGEIDTLIQKQLIRAYYACISYTDAQIGKIIAALKEKKIYDQTIIVIIGDHGYHLGDLNLWTKQTNFDWATRAPMLIKAPNQITMGYQTDALVEFVDIYPTLCDLANLPIPDSLAGTSIKKAFYKQIDKHKPFAYSQYPRKKGKIMGYSVRSRYHRLTQWINTETNQIDSEELYDYRKREIEIRNVIGEKRYTRIYKKLARALIKYHQIKA